METNPTTERIDTMTNAEALQKIADAEREVARYERINPPAPAGDIRHDSDIADLTRYLQSEDSPLYPGKWS